MGKYQYDIINGQRIEKNVNTAFQRLRAAFKKQFRLDLLVSSGTRTRADQQKLWDAWVARLPGAALAAQPGFSNHEEDGPRGPRALDLRDSGSDKGVMTAGTVRANWLRANAAKFGFSAAGYGFSRPEPWHYEFTGKIGVYPGPKFPLGKHSYFGPKKPLWNLRSVSGFYGHRSDLARFQARLKQLGYKITADGLYGDQTARITKQFQRDHKLKVDGLIGLKTWTAAWA